MAQQLVLIDPKDVDWRIDERTKAVGLRGIAAARQALAEAACQRSEQLGDDRHAA